MAAKVGKDCAVKLGTVKTVGLGTWAMTGIDADSLEDTEFGDDYKTYTVGLNESGQITFSGYYDPTDATGQISIRDYWRAGTAVTSLRLFVDSVSYWTPTTTNPLSHVNFTSWDINADKSGLVQASFTAKVSGKMELL